MTTPARDSRLGLLVGTGRCGSSLVHEVLARHPDVGFVSNLADRLPGGGALARVAGPAYRLLPPEAARKGRLRLAPSEGYRLLAAQVSPGLARSSRDLLAEDLTPVLRTRLRAFFHRQAAAAGRPVFVHKLTGWPRTGLLLEALPEARVVHVVRDGRAVATSLLQASWWGGYGGPSGWRYGPLPPDYQALWEQSGRSYVVLAALTWRLLMDAYELAEAAAPRGQWLTLRYEDVVRRPHEQFARVLSHLGLEWTAAFERGLRRYTFVPSRNEAAWNDLSARHRRQLEGSLGDAMRRYGYPRPFAAAANGAHNVLERL